MLAAQESDGRSPHGPAGCAGCLKKLGEYREGGEYRDQPTTQKAAASGTKNFTAYEKIFWKLQMYADVTADVADFEIVLIELVWQVSRHPWG